MRTALRTAKVAVSDEDETRLAVPIQVAGNVIGVLDGRKRRDRSSRSPRGAGRAHGSWTEEEVAAMEELAAQLGQVLDRAQLYQAAQSRGVGIHHRSSQCIGSRGATDGCKRHQYWQMVVAVYKQSFDLVKGKIKWINYAYDATAQWSLS